MIRNESRELSQPRLTVLVTIAGRRSRRTLLLVAQVVLFVAFLLAGARLGLVDSVSQALAVCLLGSWLWQLTAGQRAGVSALDASGQQVTLRRLDLERALHLGVAPDGSLRVVAGAPGGERRFVGRDAERVALAALRWVNRAGTVEPGSLAEVERLLRHAPNAGALLQRARRVERPGQPAAFAEVSGEATVALRDVEPDVRQALEAVLTSREP